MASKTPPDLLFGNDLFVQYPVMEKLYDIEAHTDEIDDIDLSPAGNRVSFK